MEEKQYGGTDNLEVMKIAVNYNKFLVKQVTKFIDKKKTTLEFGAGIGTFAKVFHHLGYRITCIENDAYLYDCLCSLGLKTHKDINLLEEPVENIYSLNVLEHIENDQTILDAFHRKLSPGGKLYLYVPAFQLLYSSMDKKTGHFRRYRKSGLLPKLKKSGFRILKANYADSLGFFASLLFKLLGNDKGDLNPLALKLYDRYIFPLSRGCDFFLSAFVGKNLEILAVKDKK